VTAGSRVGGRAVLFTSVPRYGCAHSSDPTAACNAAMACRKRKENLFMKLRNCKACISTTGGAQGCAGRAERATEYSAARESCSRFTVVAGPDGLVLATRERGLQVEPASIHNAGDETV